MTKQGLTLGSAGPYGMPEPRGAYQRHATIALLIAVAAHLIAIGCFCVTGMFFPDAEPIQAIRKIIVLGDFPAPSIMNTDVVQQARVSVAAAKVTPGVPVPAPDVDVSADQTIPSQGDPTHVAGPGSETGSSTGVVQATPDFRIEDEDPPIFLRVEIPPVPVRVVTPEYPDVAKRAGMEGTVWVRMLVDKEGKVRKVVVVKSDEEVFSTAAVNAAMQFVFTPAMMSTGPVAVWAAMPFRFKLNK